MTPDTGGVWLAGVARDLRSALGELEAFSRAQAPAAGALADSSRSLELAAKELAQPRGAWPRGRWDEELTAGAVAEGVWRALRRQQQGDWSGGSAAAPWGGSLAVTGTGYGRMGASVTGRGARAQTYGAIGGAIGYAIGGPVGAFVLGALGGLLGGRSDRSRSEGEGRAWLNSPEGFEVEAYLYNLARPALSMPWSGAPRLTGGVPTAPVSSRGRSFSPTVGAPVVQVQMAPGAIQISGQGEEAGEQAARAFAGYVGRALLLNSVVAPAAGWLGDL